MKVLFHTQSLLPPRTGIGFYTQHLIQEMLHHREVEELAGFLGGKIFTGLALESHLQLDPGGSSATETRLSVPGLDFRLGKAEIKKFVRSIPGAYAMRQALREWQDGRSLSILARERYVYHEPNYIPLQYSGPLVITVHDLSHIRHPDYHPPERVAFLAENLARSLQRADRILADSHFVASEIEDVFATPREKIAVTHLGADETFRPREEPEVASTLAIFGLRYRAFILSVATLEPRKNLTRLIKGYTALPDQLRREYPLVLVGEAGWKNTELRASVRELEARGEIIRTGYLPRAQILDLYSSAAIFAYPSLYEGFGLPVLEAFSSNTPVLTSNISSLPEVSSGAALEVDPYSMDAIAHGLYTLLESESVREHHASLGLARSKTFSWANCAEQTLAVYRQLV